MSRAVRGGDELTAERQHEQRDCLKAKTALDLLPYLKTSPERGAFWRANETRRVSSTRESDHRIRTVAVLRSQPALGGNRRHTGGTLVCLPRRAVARPMRPHRIPCHRRANHRRFATPCGSGTASHRIRSVHVNRGHSHNPSVTTKLSVARPPPEDGSMRLNLYQLFSPIGLTNISFENEE